MKRLVSALAIGCLLLGLAPATLAAGPTRHFERVDRSLDKIDPSFRPMLADTTRKVTVIVQLDAQPAVAFSTATADRRAHAKALRSSQGRLDARISKLGGKVLDRYQYAYNGIKVRVTGAQLARLAKLPGVVGIRRVQTYKPTNVNAIPYVGAPSAWQTSGATGAGTTIAIVDTGIDYSHADFNGTGVTLPFDQNNPTIIEPGSFPTGKVIAGYDFAGNDYDAEGDNGSTTPTPDPDPLDCYGHGTHVAGTAAGQGVLADHSTYSGPYDPSIYSDPTTFGIGPGVAPEAKLVALKVFGCAGSTDLVIDALEWVAAYNVAHHDGIDVVNMSLGGVFGSNDDPDAVATNNLVSMGVVVVAAGGNASAVPFILDGPGAATKAISVTALDAFPVMPMAIVDLPSGPDINGNNQNAYPALPVSGTLHVVPNGTGGVSLGCAAGDYDAGSAGKIVAIKRGVCAFVDKGAAAQAAGAIGIVLINRDDTAPGDLPTFIGYNPELFEIPMVGVDKTAQPTLLANEGASITLVDNGSQPNPTYQEIAAFSSSGPRYGDNWLKPDVAAPGVSLISALIGSGWNGTTNSGTSMATPVTSGSAALVIQKHPGWSPLKVKAALSNTADTSSAKIVDYDPLRAGAGVVQVDRAVNTVGLATTSQGTASLSFGYEPLDGAYRETKEITLWNTGSKAITYNLAGSSPLVSIWPSSVTVRGHDSKDVKVTASLSKDQVAALPSADQFVTGAFGELNSLSGAITATPTSSGAGIYPLRVAYLLVPRGLSDVEATSGRSWHKWGIKPQHGGWNPDPILDANLRIRNGGIHDGFADLYAFGDFDQPGDGTHGTDVRVTGVQALPAEILTGTPDPGDRGIQFVINMWDRFSTPAPNEIDVAVDTNNDGEVDYYVVGIDEGALFADAFDGLYISVIFDADFNPIDAWLANAPLNGSTIILPALASDLGLTAGAGSFSYSVAAFDGFTLTADETDASPVFDVFDPAQSTGDFVPVPSREKVTVPVWAKKSAIFHGDVKGWLVVTLDDANGRDQADIVRP